MKSVLITANALVLALFQASLNAQVQWTILSPATSPGPKARHRMVYDSYRDRVVLFGGFDVNRRTSSNETWEWDGNSWTQRFPLHIPPARGDQGMAYDVARRCTVLFGGGEPTIYADTWEWDGNDWTNRTPSISPPARRAAGMAYDHARRHTVLFGGYGGGSTNFSDTWIWNGSTWTQVAVGGPPARNEFFLVYDIRRARTILFGGSRFNDTWEWDGYSWSQAFPSTSPSPRSHFAMAYDYSRGRVVGFGGYSGNFLQDAWEWTGSNWIQRLPGTVPGPRETHCLVYDESRSEIIMYGGYKGSDYADTWRYAAVNQARFLPFGAGCPTGSPPGLRTTVSGLPWLGESIAIELFNLPSGAATLMSIGYSRTQWMGLSLPFDLGPIGFPGCNLYSSLNILVAIPSSGGAAFLSLPIPNFANLIGVEFYPQGFASHLGALLVSNAATGKIGAL